MIQNNSVDLSIIIPTYREAKNLEKLVPRLWSVMQEEKRSYEILVVDDNSKDGTEALIQKYAADGIPISAHIRLQERGLGTAVLFGMKKARGDILLCMDADLSHRPEDIPRLLSEFQKQNPPDMVVGSRFTQGGKIDQKWGAHRWVNSYVATLLSGPLLYETITDPMAGFFALQRSVFQRTSHLNPIGYKIGLEIMLKCACSQVIEIPITFEDRQEGTSKLNGKERIRYLEHLSRLYDFRYPRLSSSLKYIITIGLGFLLNWLFFFSLDAWPTNFSHRLILSYVPAISISMPMARVSLAGSLPCIQPIWP